MTNEILSNDYLVVPLLAWVATQVIKFTAEALKGNIDFRQFYQSGGIPSGHTAVVVSLLLIVLINQGISSPLLGVVAVLTTIVIYDALGVRRATGVQAEYLEKILNQLEIKQTEPVVSRLSHGHTPLEVLYGAILGTILALVFSLEKLGGTLGVLIDQRTNSDNLIFSIIFTLLTLLSILVIFLAGRPQNRRLPTWSNIRRIVTWTVLAPSVVGSLVIWVSQQGVSEVGSRIVPMLIIAFILTVNVFAYIKLYRVAADRLKEEQQHFIKSAKKRTKTRSKSSKSKNRRRKK